MSFAVAVAASGGRDSTALLHCTARLVRQHGGEVHALHVHHGLVAQADEWLAQVRAQCRRWGVHFHAARLTSGPDRGESLEAWARRERYQALGEMARAAGCTMVLLAHHRRDQAETLLLQALRGGGPAGLAAMPRSATRAGITWARPWLQMPREAIEAYVARHRLRWCEDASNADTRFARNRLRALWPRWLQAFPDAESQLEAAAARAAEAAACLREQVAGDLVHVGGAGGPLDVAAWGALSAPRRTQVLRAWLRGTAPGATESLVQRLAQELPAARSARWPAPGGELRLYRGFLSFAATAPAGPSGEPVVLSLRRAGRHSVAGWHGTLVLEQVAEGGVAGARLLHAQARARCGGEQFQAAPGAVPRALKKQFQALGVPAWEREGPLLFDGEALLFVPGLGIDARSRAAPGEAQFSLRWEPARAG